MKESFLTDVPLNQERADRANEKLRVTMGRGGEEIVPRMSADASDNTTKYCFCEQLLS